MVIYAGSYHLSNTMDGENRIILNVGGVRYVNVYLCTNLKRVYIHWLCVVLFKYIEASHLPSALLVCSFSLSFRIEFLYPIPHNDMRLIYVFVYVCVCKQN